MNLFVNYLSVYIAVANSWSLKESGEPWTSATSKYGRGYAKTPGGGETKKELAFMVSLI